MKKQTTNPKSEKTPIGSSTELVAGASTIRKWKYPLNLTKVHTKQVVEFIKKKGEFIRLDLEQEFSIYIGRAYWHVKNLLDKKLIRKTNKSISLQEKGKIYAVYKTGKI